MPANPGTTNPILLTRLADWRDHPAWAEFVKRYAPFVLARCRRFQLDDLSAEDVSQRIWIGLAQRLASFRYDPSGSFRAWLRRYCDSRLIDRLRTREPMRDVPIDEAFGPDGPPARSDEIPTERDDESRTERTLLLALAAQVHERVRSQVSPDTWRAFWLIAVEDRSVREAAESLGKSYAAAFAAQKRVRQILRAEGRKVLEQPAQIDSGPRPADEASAPA
jgi:RNA polymerase sigma-70 factor (ECF subfamily)